MKFKITQISENSEPCIANGIDEYINKSYIIGSEIELGMYNDDNLKTISLFHEIGHRLITKEYLEFVKYNPYDIEREFWRIAFQIAKFSGFKFKMYVFRWAINQCNTYK